MINSKTSSILSMVSAIVVHAGQAHLDEVLAVALLFGAMGRKVPVVRRDPTDEEKGNPNVLVVDVGMQHDPDKGNFDHHQEKGLPAAFVLVARWLGIDDLARQVFGWWSRASDMDTSGPFALAKAMGTTPDNLFSVLSPLEKFVVAKFQQDPNSVGDLLLEWGKEILEGISKTNERLEWLGNHAEVVDLGGVQAIFHETPGSQTPNLAMEIFRGRSAPEAGISITRDDRGPGWALYRYSDHPRVDFSRLEGKDKVVFAHKGGFIAKVGDMPIEEAIELARLAVK